VTEPGADLRSATHEDRLVLLEALVPALQARIEHLEKRLREFEARQSDFVVWHVPAAGAPDQP
jgi:hypothetical protein